MNTISVDADVINAELIYNRYDLIYPTSEVDQWSEDGRIIYGHFSDGGYELSLNCRHVSASLMDKAIGETFQKYRGLKCIRINGYGLNYRGVLIEGNTFIVDVPETAEQIEDTIGRKGRYNMRRAEQNLVKEIGGELSYVYYDSSIPDSVVYEYFFFKNATHHKDYNMLPKEYLKRYHVTGALRLCVGNKTIAVLFFCENNKTAFLENISYDTHYAKWSPGMLLYHSFLLKMSSMGVKRVFLGGGSYSYKQRFGSRQFAVYSGRIFRTSIETHVFYLLNRIRHFFIDQGLVGPIVGKSVFTKLLDPLRRTRDALRRLNETWSYYEICGSDHGEVPDDVVFASNWRDFCDVMKKLHEPVLRWQYERFKSDSSVSFVALTDGESLLSRGWITDTNRDLVKGHDRPGARILYDFVTPENKRRHGYYTRLLRALVRNGHYIIYVSPHNIPSRRAIENVGFVRYA